MCRQPARRRQLCTAKPTKRTSFCARRALPLPLSLVRDEALDGFSHVAHERPPSVLTVRENLHSGLPLHLQHIQNSAILHATEFIRIQTSLGTSGTRFQQLGRPQQASYLICSILSFHGSPFCVTPRRT